MESRLKFQHLNSELSHMKHSQEVFQSDLQAVEIRLVYVSWECFMCDNTELSCQHFYNGSQWRF